MAYRLDEIVGYNLRTMRIEKQLTQGALAELANVSKQTISNIEKGQGANSKTIERIAECLGTSPLAFYREINHGVDFVFKRVSPKTARLDKEQYTAQIEHVIDSVIRETKDTLYFVSVMPTVKEMFAENKWKLLENPSAEKLTSFQDVLLFQIRQAVFQSDGDEFDELIDPKEG